jgi:hypothetical protein
MSKIDIDIYYGFTTQQHWEASATTGDTAAELSAFFAYVVIL